VASLQSKSGVVPFSDSKQFISVALRLIAFHFITFVACRKKLNKT
jgi:hypothetical protein